MPSKPECGAGTNRCNIQPPTNSGTGCSHYIQWASFTGNTLHVCPEGRRNRATISNCRGADKFYCAFGDASVNVGTVNWEPLFVVT